LGFILCFGLRFRYTTADVLLLIAPLGIIFASFFSSTRLLSHLFPGPASLLRRWWFFFDFLGFIQIIKDLLLRIILVIPFLVESIISILINIFSRIVRNIIGAGITTIHGFSSLLYYFILVPSNFSDLVHNSFPFNYSLPSSLARRDVLEWPGLPSISCALIQEGEPDIAGPGVLSSAFWH
jgi:hypothetical protein